MIYATGTNYHFFLASPNSLARFQSVAKPFYPIPSKNIPPLPGITSEPFIVPKFLYEIHYERKRFESTPAETPPYISYDGKTIFCQIRFGENLYYQNTLGDRVVRISSFPFPAPSLSPFTIIHEEKSITIGGTIQTPKTIFVSKREIYEHTRYLSLRDIVNPSLTEEDIIEKISDLYFNKANKLYLFRLVQILYAGTPSEETKIIQNLFRFEPEFANFLSASIFSIELIPLIHGPFLQKILLNLDERYIKYQLPSLSPPVLKVLESSVSKNKWKEITNAPSKKPALGEDLVSVIEEELYKQFSRRIYFETGTRLVYRETEEFSLKEETIPFVNADKVNFCINLPCLEFYGRTNTKLFFRTKDWIEVLRFDFFLHKKEVQTSEFHKLPAKLIISIPYYQTGIFLVGGGITNERKTFECSLLWFDY